MHAVIGALVLVCGALLASPGMARVDVRFTSPEAYSDQDFRKASERAGIIGSLERHFDKLGDRYLKPGQTVRIEVLDIRLAGQREPWRHGFDDVRVLRDTTPPRFKMRYSLVENGKTLIKGEETVTDMNYLSNSGSGLSSGRLSHEKTMLGKWFHRRFVAMRPPR